MWDQQGSATILRTLDPGDFSSGALFINNRGQVVGRSGNFAFFWSQGTGMLPLGQLENTEVSWAIGINDDGKIVGFSYVNGGPRATLWDDAGPHDLNTLLDDSGEGWRLSDAWAIGNGGHIVGTGFNPQGAVRAFLLTPVVVPEPSGIAIAGVGAALLLVRRPRSVRKSSPALFLSSQSASLRSRPPAPAA